jgi:AraC family transcriptional regulator
MQDFEDRRIVGGTLDNAWIGGATQARVELLQRRSSGRLHWSFQQHAATLFWFRRGFRDATIVVDGHQHHMRLSAGPRLGIFLPGASIEGTFVTATECQYLAVFAHDLELARHLQAKTAEPFAIVDDYRLREALGDLTDELRWQRSLKDLFIEATALQCMVRAARQAQDESPPTSTPHAGILGRLNEYIDNRIGEAIQVADLASATGYSVRHLSRMLKSQTGRTPMGFVQHRRLKKARALLQSGYPSITALAYATGFSSPQHFSTAFKREFGVPPTRSGHHNHVTDRPNPPVQSVETVVQE